MEQLSLRGELNSSKICKLSPWELRQGERTWGLSACILCFVKCDLMSGEISMTTSKYGKSYRSMILHGFTESTVLSLSYRFKSSDRSLTL